MANITVTFTITEFLFAHRRDGRGLNEIVGLPA